MNLVTVFSINFLTRSRSVADSLSGADKYITSSTILFGSIITNFQRSQNDMMLQSIKVKYKKFPNFDR